MYDVMKRCIHAHMISVAGLWHSVTFCFAHLAVCQSREYKKFAKRTSSSSASACCNASPTKIARSLKMGQAPTLQTLSSKVSQASTDICSSPSSTAGQEEDEDDSKHMQDVK